MFADSGEARYTKSKSELMNKFESRSSTQRNQSRVNIDGGGKHHSAVYWPKDGMVRDHLTSIERYESKFNNSDVCMIFDRYFPNIIKCSKTRLQRVDGFRRVHQIGSNSPLTAKDVCMSSTKTKQSLIEIISEYQLEKFNEEELQHKLVVTSNDVIPEETANGTRKKGV